MSDAVDATDVDVLLAQLRAVVDGLQSLPLARMGGNEVLALWAELETQLRRLPSVDQAIVAEVEARRLTEQAGWRDARSFMIGVLRIAPAEATARVYAAQVFGPRRGLTGEDLAPLLPAVATALAEGVMSVAHGRVIEAAVEALPVAVQAERGAELEAKLVEASARFDPTGVRKLAQRAVAVLDPDGIEPQDKLIEANRGVTARERRDGSVRLVAELSKLDYATVKTVWDVTAAPKSVDGQTDDRTPAARRLDGILDALRGALRTRQVPTTHGAATMITLTMTVDQHAAYLAAKANGLSPRECAAAGGLVTTGHGDLLSLDSASHLLADATYAIAVLSARDPITGLRRVDAFDHLGRFFRPPQHRALAARDKGCSFPGCQIPPAWCEAHHVTPYAVSGHTKINDGTLLCRYHHQHHQRLGWHCDMTDGLPRWRHHSDTRDLATAPVCSEREGGENRTTDRVPTPS